VVVGDDVDFGTACRGPDVKAVSLPMQCGQPLCIGQQAHGFGVRADDRDARSRTSRDQVGARAWYPGTQPQRVHLGSPQGGHDVGIGAGAGPSGQALHVVGLAAVPGLRIRVAVDQHRGDGWCRLRVVQFAGGVEHAHGGLAMVEDAQTVDAGHGVAFLLQRPNVARRSAATAAAMGVGSGMDW
jgi:hypothetical protein